MICVSSLLFSIMTFTRLTVWVTKRNILNIFWSYGVGQHGNKVTRVTRVNIFSDHLFHLVRYKYLFMNILHVFQVHSDLRHVMSLKTCESRCNSEGRYGSILNIYQCSTTHDSLNTSKAFSRFTIYTYRYPFSSTDVTSLITIILPLLLHSSTIDEFYKSLASISFLTIKNISISKEITRSLIVEN